MAASKDPSAFITDREFARVFLGVPTIFYGFGRYYVLIGRLSGDGLNHTIWDLRGPDAGLARVRGFTQPKGC